MFLCLTESVRSYYNLILKKAGQFLTDLQVNLLKFALSLRSYSPAVHASQQVCCDQNVIYLTIIKLSEMQPRYIMSEPGPFLVREMSLYPNVDPECSAALLAVFLNCLGPVFK